MKKLNKNEIKRFMQRPTISTSLPLIVLVVVATLINPNFLTWSNVTSIMRSYVFIALIALGMTFIFIEKDIDISVGSLLGLSGAVAGYLMVEGVPVVAAILIAIVISILCGFLTGFFIVHFDIPPMIGSLGMQFMLRGVIYIMTEGTPIYPLPEEFTAITKINLGGIPLQMFIYILFALICGFLLHKTVYGRYIFAVGGNADTAWLCGINVKFVRISAYCLTGFLCGVAGGLMTSPGASAPANAGYGYEMYAIASVVVGGASPAGGVGSIPGTVVGSILIGILQNVMVLVGISVYWQYVAIGGIILLAVILDQNNKKRALATASKGKANAGGE